MERDCEYEVKYSHKRLYSDFNFVEKAEVEVYWMSERPLKFYIDSRRFNVGMVLLSRKRNQALNHAWKFETKVKGNLPTQFPKRRDLIETAIHIGARVAINLHHTLLNQV
ncbi:hypothetical protein ALC57_08572 [Trachymyrmex cornetzi]|uniref:Uncharacterized protein n=1 Tax=Trachymyrmex cornetzi TaxID=471704 RepID=A0A151J6S2_9HYME|nr:hypothetical protein ALC57_08572 [Trachymyrmex cornetzi]